MSREYDLEGPKLWETGASGYNFQLKSLCEKYVRCIISVSVSLNLLLVLIKCTMLAVDCNNYPRKRGRLLHHCYSKERADRKASVTHICYGY